MLQSVRDQILTAFCDLLAADGGPQVNGANIPVLRSQTRPLVREDTIPSYVVTPAQETIEPTDHDSQLRTLGLRVVCVYGDPEIDEERLDQKVDPQVCWVESCLSDETFGGLAHRAEVRQTTYHIDEADEGYIGAEMSLEIQYFTARNQPEVRA